MGRRTQMLRKEFAPIRSAMLKQHKVCQECGAGGKLEVHHKVPLVLGGTNELSNLVVVCASCHALNHAHDRGELTAAGIKEVKDERGSYRTSHSLVSFQELEMKMIQLADDCDGSRASWKEIFDVIDSLKHRKSLYMSDDECDAYRGFWHSREVEMYSEDCSEQMVINTD